jgi:predicted 3-demethylubiquinone-9 3-methyltransferase (glyoxalase superfamily)
MTSLLQVMCETQEELGRYWSKLSAGGDDKAQQCGWLKDRYGLCWQIVPAVLADMIADRDAGKTGRVMSAMLMSAAGVTSAPGRNSRGRSSISAH